MSLTFLCHFDVLDSANILAQLKVIRAALIATENSDLVGYLQRSPSWLWLGTIGAYAVRSKIDNRSEPLLDGFFGLLGLATAAERRQARNGHGRLLLVSEQ